MKITVKAAAGLRVPMAGAPRKYIGSAPVQVPASAYYLRRLADGDLVRADEPAPEPAPEPTPEPTKDATAGKSAKGGKK